MLQQNIKAQLRSKVWSKMLQNVIMSNIAQSDGQYFSIYCN